MHCCRFGETDDGDVDNHCDNECDGRIGSLFAAVVGVGSLGYGGMLAVADSLCGGCAKICAWIGNGSYRVCVGSVSRMAVLAGVSSMGVAVLHGYRTDVCWFE